MTLPETIPAPYRYAQQLYEFMAKGSTVEVIDGKPRKVWQGHLTKAITEELHLSVPYYTKITTLLKRSECIVMIQRGGNSAMSKWVLLREPSAELFDSVVEVDDVDGKSPLTATRLKDNRNAQSFRDLNERLNKLEDKVLILQARFGDEPDTEDDSD